MLKDNERKKIQKDILEWDEKNEEALHVISFIVTDRLQGPIHYGVTAKGAWDELRKVHAPNDKQRKYSLIKRLYRLDMQVGSSLMGHESIFDDLVQSLAAIGKNIDPEELIILYANSLPVETFGNWIQGPKWHSLTTCQLPTSKVVFAKKQDDSTLLVLARD